MASLADRFGRRKMIMWSAIVFAIGALGSGISGSTSFLIVSRIILGVAVGGASALFRCIWERLCPAEDMRKTIWSKSVNDNCRNAYCIWCKLCFCTCI